MLEVHVICIMMDHDGESKEVGIIGRFMDEELYSMSWDRANERVIPKLNERTDEGYSFRLESYWSHIDSYNYWWEETEDFSDLLG